LVVEPGQSLEGLLVEAEGLYNKKIILEKAGYTFEHIICTHLINLYLRGGGLVADVVAGVAFDVLVVKAVLLVVVVGEAVSVKKRDNIYQKKNCIREGYTFCEHIICTHHISVSTLYSRGFTGGIVGSGTVPLLFTERFRIEKKGYLLEHILGYIQYTSNNIYTYLKADELESDHHLVRLDPRLDPSY